MALKTVYHIFSADEAEKRIKCLKDRIRIKKGTEMINLLDLGIAKYTHMQ